MSNMGLVILEDLFRSYKLQWFGFRGGCHEKTTERLIAVILGESTEERTHCFVKGQIINFWCLQTIQCLAI